MKPVLAWQLRDRENMGKRVRTWESGYPPLFFMLPSVSRGRCCHRTSGLTFQVFCWFRLLLVSEMKLCKRHRMSAVRKLEKWVLHGRQWTLKRWPILAERRRNFLNICIGSKNAFVMTPPARIAPASHVAYCCFPKGSWKLIIFVAFPRGSRPSMTVTSFLEGMFPTRLRRAAHRCPILAEVTI